jgi:tetratricopeptide (TPR) repeat protein
MIVRDEAKNLSQCLKSVGNLVDETMILDTGSQDQTIAIAQSFGARVETYTWTHNFAAARNYALGYVTGDWVLVLDADERFVPQQAEALRSLLHHPDHLVINLLRQEVGASQSPYSLVSRVFRRHPAIQFSRPYHAMIDDSVITLQHQEPQWKVVTLPTVAIVHEGYQQAVIAQKSKVDRARQAMESYLAEHPKDAYTCAKLGALYNEIGDGLRGVGLLCQGLDNVDLEPDIAYELHYHLGLAYSRLGQVAEAMNHYQQAIAQAVLPTLKLGAYNNLGNLCKASGQLAQSQSLYEQVIQLDPTFAQGHYNLGLLKKAQGDLPGAIAAYTTALSHNPHYAEAYQNLGVTLLKLGQVEQSLEAFGSLGLRV